MSDFCEMVSQGFSVGRCSTEMAEDSVKPACIGTMKEKDGVWYRIIASAHLSRPEDYFSIYQSGCNHGCINCHSWRLTQRFEGFWASTNDIADMAATYELQVTTQEPRERATMWHATDLCHHCGSCKISGVRGSRCPVKLKPEQVISSPQGWGPARNIISFTGGDVTCKPWFYAQAAEKIKAACSEKMWILLETNGYGLTLENLEVLASGGVDSFWLDIKAYDEDVYRRLCGTTNNWILQAPSRIVDRGFVLEVLTLFIPGWVEEDQITKIAELICDIDPDIPFTILAFFPEYRLKKNPTPTLMEMIQTYFKVKDTGLRKVKLGNCHIFTKTAEEWMLLSSTVGWEGIG